MIFNIFFTSSLVLGWYTTLSPTGTFGNLRFIECVEKKLSQLFILRKLKMSRQVKHKCLFFNQRTVFSVT